MQAVRRLACFNGKLREGMPWPLRIHFTHGCPRGELLGESHVPAFDRLLLRMRRLKCVVVLMEGFVCKSFFFLPNKDIYCLVGFVQ